MSATDDALEGRIAQLLAAGDRRGAVTVALRGFGPQILGYLQAVLRSTEDGSEAFSRFGEALWVGIDTYARRSSFKAWAYTVAWHAALRCVNDPHRKRAVPLVAEAAELCEEVRTATAPYLKTTNKAHLAALRESLTPEDQTLLILRLDRGLSWAEIGEVLTESGEVASDAALRKRFERVKDRLRELAIAQGLVTEE